MVILAVSEGPGTFPPTQFAAVSQSPPVGAVVVFQVIVDITIRVLQALEQGPQVQRPPSLREQSASHRSKVSQRESWQTVHGRTPLFPGGWRAE